MSATDDARYELKKLKPMPKETVEHLAKRMFDLQIEVYSANAGFDLDTAGLTWPNIPEEDKEDWREAAHEKLKLKVIRRNSRMP